MRTAVVSILIAGVVCIPSSRIFAQDNGNFTYTLHRAANPSADQQDAYEKIAVAMDGALGYYNRYTSITKSLDVHYNTGVSTADANFDGTIRFGSNRSYMVVLTALHEIAHTVGVGTTPEYRNLIREGIFTGIHATETLRALTGDSDTLLHGDQQHFWPYGLNYSSEYKSESDFIFHCKIVDAMYRDMFREEVYRICRLRSKSDGRCMSAAGENSLTLGDCSGSASIVRIVALANNGMYRLEFGGRVLDIPNESTQAGEAAGLWSWNGGGHQRAVLEFEPAGAGDYVRIRMSHSDLYLATRGDDIVQERPATSDDSQSWELFGGDSVVSIAQGTVRRSSMEIGMAARELVFRIPRGLFLSIARFSMWPAGSSPRPR